MLDMDKIFMHEISKAMFPISTMSSNIEKKNKEIDSFSNEVEKCSKKVEKLQKQISNHISKEIALESLKSLNSEVSASIEAINLQAAQMVASQNNQTSLNCHIVANKPQSLSLTHSYETSSLSKRKKRKLSPTDSSFSNRTVVNTRKKLKVMGKT